MPGPWRSRPEFVRALNAGGHAFLLGGTELLNRRTSYRLSLYSSVRVKSCELRCISHERSLRGAQELQHAGAALLAAGGLQLTVDSVQLTHAPAHWLQLDRSGRMLDIYAAYVRCMATPQRYCSFGMHQFNLPDVAVPAGVGLVEASRSISAFNLYVLREQPALATGHTFCADDGAPRLRLRRLMPQIGVNTTAGHNPLGYWLLAPT